MIHNTNLISALCGYEITKGFHLNDSRNLMSTQKMTIKDILKSKSVRQWHGRLGFNPRLSHTKD